MTFSIRLSDRVTRLSDQHRKSEKSLHGMASEPTLSMDNGNLDWENSTAQPGRLSWEGLTSG